MNNYLEWKKAHPHLHKKYLKRLRESYKLRRQTDPEFFKKQNEKARVRDYIKRHNDPVYAERRRNTVRNYWKRQPVEKRKKRRRVYFEKLKNNPIKLGAFYARERAYKNARNKLLKTCPHCGGEVSVLMWKLKLIERENQCKLQKRLSRGSLKKPKRTRN